MNRCKRLHVILKLQNKVKISCKIGQIKAGTAAQLNVSQPPVMSTRPEDKEKGIADPQRKGETRV